MRNEIIVLFFDKESKKEDGHIFYDYDSFGRWYIDNYSYVDILDIRKQEE